MATRRPAIRPTAAFIALLTVLGLGALYGATSALVPLIKLNAIILTLAAMAGFLTHAGLQRGLFTNLGVALVSAALGVAAMWGVWLGLEYPAELLSGLEKQGAQGVVELVTGLARTTTVSLRGAGWPPARPDRRNRAEPDPEGRRFLCKWTSHRRHPMSYTTENTRTPPNHTTNNYTTNTTVPPQRSGGSGVALAIGAIVALAAIIAYFVIANPGPADDNVNVSIDAPAAVENSAERVGDRSEERR